MRAYALPVSVRTLFALVLALAVVFAPLLTRSGEAFAAVPDHHMQMVESGHCKAPSSSGDHHKAPAKSCCMAMCMGVALTPAAPSDERVAPRARAGFAAPIFHVGILGELATPPPKGA